MIRNPDLLREIMLAAERQPAAQDLFLRDIKSLHEDVHEIADHVQQLLDAEFIDGIALINGREMYPKIIIHRIKNPGHDFLQAMREDTIWKQVKERVMVPAGSWTLQLAVEYAKNLVRERLGLP